MFKGHYMRKYKHPTFWKLECDKIKHWLQQGYTVEDIGNEYGVSKQRIFQVMTKFGIKTTLKIRKNFLRDKPSKYYWLNHMLSHKKIPKQERLIILETLNIPDVCPILGLVLDYDGGNLGNPGWGRFENSPSLDQIIPGKGYNLENIQILSWRANRIKNDGTPEELIKIGTYLQQLNNTSL